MIYHFCNNIPLPSADDFGTFSSRDLREIISHVPLMIYFIPLHRYISPE